MCIRDSQSVVKGLFVNKKVVSEYVKGCIEEFEIACDSEASPVRMLSLIHILSDLIEYVKKQDDSVTEQE